MHIEKEQVSKLIEVLTPIDDDYTHLNIDGRAVDDINVILNKLTLRQQTVLSSLMCDVKPRDIAKSLNMATGNIYTTRKTLYTKIISTIYRYSDNVGKYSVFNIKNNSTEDNYTLNELRIKFKEFTYNQFKFMCKYKSGVAYISNRLTFLPTSQVEFLKEWLSVINDVNSNPMGILHSELLRSIHLDVLGFNTDTVFLYLDVKTYLYRLSIPTGSMHVAVPVNVSQEDFIGRAKAIALLMKQGKCYFDYEQLTNLFKQRESIDRILHISFNDTIPSGANTVPYIEELLLRIASVFIYEKL